MNKDTKQLIVNGAAIISAFLLKRAAEKLIRSTMDKEIPEEPEKDNDQTWPQAIAYAATAGALIGVFKLLVERTTDQQLEKIYD